MCIRDSFNVHPDEMVQFVLRNLGQVETEPEVLPAGEARPVLDELPSSQEMVAGLMADMPARAEPPEREVPLLRFQ
eukprot:7868192-Alexandrium_andersonii.AAC.1